MPIGTNKQTAAQFLAFVERSKELLARRAVLQHHEESFKQFVAAATPLLLPRLKSSLPLLAERAKLLSRWLTPYDVLSVAGLAGAENPYTQLTAWLLDPRTHRPSAAARQRAWLCVLGIGDQVSFTSPAIPRTWLRTEDGIPDLVFEYPSGVVVVEAKTSSAEHLAPSGTPQTSAYPRSVRARLGLPEAQVHMIYLAPSRADPDNPDAIATTFASLVVALATAMAPEDLPADLRWALSTVLTHLLNHTFPAGAEIPALLEKAQGWVVEFFRPGGDSSLMGQLKNIQLAQQLLTPEVQP